MIVKLSTGQDGAASDLAGALLRFYSLGPGHIARIVWLLFTLSFKQNGQCMHCRHFSEPPFLSGAVRDLREHSLCSIYCV